MNLTSDHTTTCSGYAPVQTPLQAVDDMRQLLADTAIQDGEKYA